MLEGGYPRETASLNELRTVEAAWNDCPKYCKIGKRVKFSFVNITLS